MRPSIHTLADPRCPHRRQPSQRPRQVSMAPYRSMAPLPPIPAMSLRVASDRWPHAGCRCDSRLTAPESATRPSGNSYWRPLKPVRFALQAQVDLDGRLQLPSTAPLASLVPTKRLPPIAAATIVPAFQPSASPSRWARRGHHGTGVSQQARNLLLVLGLGVNHNPRPPFQLTPRPRCGDPQSKTHLRPIGTAPAGQQAFPIRPSKGPEPLKGKRPTAVPFQEVTAHREMSSVPQDWSDSGVGLAMSLSQAPSYGETTTR
jgi:hypothetical protein